MIDKLIGAFGYGATLVGFVLLLMGLLAIVTAIVGAVIYYVEYNEDLEDEENARLDYSRHGDRD